MNKENGYNIKTKYEEKLAQKRNKDRIVHYINVDDEEIFLDEDEYCYYNEDDNTFVITGPYEPFIYEGEWLDIYSIKIDSEALFWKYPAADIEIQIL